MVSITGCYVNLSAGAQTGPRWVFRQGWTLPQSGSRWSMGSPIRDGVRHVPFFNSTFDSLFCPFLDPSAQHQSMECVPEIDKQARTRIRYTPFSNPSLQWRLRRVGHRDKAIGRRCLFDFLVGKENCLIARPHPHVDPHVWLAKLTSFVASLPENHWGPPEKGWVPKCEIGHSKRR